VFVRIVAFLRGEQNMACRDAVEVATDSEVESQGSLHVQSLQACDGQAEGRGDPIHDVLEVMVIVHGCEQLRAGERMDYRFTIRHVEVVNLVLLEEFEDVLRGVERGLAGGGVGQHSNPDSNASSNWLSAAVLVLLIPPKAGEVDGGVLDLLLVEKFHNL
jgi:hypothetical protein